MTDDTNDRPTRAEFERLKARVTALEAAREESDPDHSPDAADGLDSRDAAVLASLTNGESYRAHDLVRRYKAETDVRQTTTAKQRVKELLKRECFKRDGGAHYYVGE
jgi:hypothetical protein